MIKKHIDHPDEERIVFRHLLDICEVHIDISEHIYVIVIIFMPLIKSQSLSPSTTPFHSHTLCTQFTDIQRFKTLLIAQII